LQKEFDINIVWTAFPLHPETPREGRRLEELFAGRPINISQMLDHLTRVAEDLGLPFGKREKTYNSRLAQELAKFAEQQGKGEEYHSAVFRAYFADGRNIALMPTLLEVGNSIGLSTDHIQEVLEKRTFKEAVDKDWARSFQMGVTAVPTFMMNRTSLVGAQPYAKLVELLETNQVKRLP
jgi:predicted DsbA family dithiol-disulfide isomerase